MKINFYIFYLSCFLSSLSIFGINKKDSLYAVVNKKEVPDTVMLNSYEQLLGLVKITDINERIDLHLKKVELSKKIINRYSTDTSLVLKIRMELNTSLNSLAVLYSDVGNISKALDYFEESKRLLYVIEDKKEIAFNLINSGYTYWVNGFLEEARVNITTALSIGEELNDELIIGRSISALGSFFVQEGELDSAKYYYEIALVKAQELHQKESIAVLSNSLGYVAHLKGNDSLALVYFQKALAGFEEVNNKEEMTIALRDISKLSLKKRDLKQALIFAEKSYEIAREIGYPMSIKFSAQLLSEIYAAQDKGMKALEFYKISILMRDSLEKESNTKAIAQQQAKYKYEQQKVIDNAAHEKALVIEQQLKKQQEIITLAVTLGLILTAIFLTYVFRKLQSTRKQKKIIELQKEELSLTHEQLSEASLEISDSIDYAELIQQAVLPSLKIEDLTKDSFIYFNPKEKVSGDFFWFEQRQEYKGYAVADCTGHGIPGAFISMIGTILLNEIYNSKQIDIPNQILDELSRLVKLTLTDKEGYTMKDGMDISFAVLNNETKMLYFSGANNPVWIASKNPEKRINKETALPIGEVNGLYMYEIKGDKQPIGEYGEHVKPFTLNSAHLEEGDAFYLFSDGYVDQFGGERNKKFKAKPFRELLLSIHEQTMDEQKTILAQNFRDWKGDYEQIDDVTVMGVRV